MDGSETVCKNLHSRLHSAVKQCQVQFGGKSEVATEQDECVQTILCEWESVLNHGVKQKGSSLMGLIGKGGKEDDRLWKFVRECLSVDDVKRLQSLAQVKTGLGFVRAWLRAALNERTLEYALTEMLRDEKLNTCYESEAFVRNQEYASTLPDMAAGGWSDCEIWAGMVDVWLVL
jgi:sorting nexin-29